uniref:Uncharacterized protein n=1 Tax=Arundo donax TaxID=35708 RepID=A0A0A9GXM3_ARUDO
MVANIFMFLHQQIPLHSKTTSFCTWIAAKTISFGVCFFFLSVQLRNDLVIL